MDEKKHHHAGSFASHMYVEILEVLLGLYSSKDTLMNTARRMYEQVQYIYKEGEIYFFHITYDI